jgi:glucose/arabinose dehydrogenase/fibronectin type 3 domain-containing protein
MLALAALPAAAQTFTDSAFTSEVVTTLQALKPVGLTWAPDGRLFIWQKDGVVRIFKNGSLLPTPFLNISSQVNTYVDRGALGLALHPDFANNGYVYLLFTREEGGNPNDSSPKVSRLIRVTANPSNPDVALAGSEVILLGSITTPPCSNYAVGSDCIPSDSNTHSIGTLRFAPDGKLFVGNGDGAEASGVDARALRARDLNQYSGKILRINDDGTAPGDNPFDDGTNSIRSKVWAFGLRNPYRFTLDPATNDVLLGDVGWDTWEEVDRVSRGGDYGWPCYEGFLVQPLYTAQLGDCGLVPPGSVTPPLVSWAHDDVSPALPGYDPSFLGSAAIGGPIYTGASYPELYLGSYFYGDYTGGWIRRLTFAADGHVQSNTVFATGIDGLVSIEQGPDGDLYYVQFSTGQIRRIRFNGPVARATATPSYGYSPLSVSFQGDQSLNPAGGSLIYAWQFGDGQTSAVANPSHTYTSATVQTFLARLTVTDTNGKSSSATEPITVGSIPPTPSIQVPTDGTGFRPGQLVAYQGSATDPEETLGPGALSWTVLLHHHDHIHTMLESTGATGAFTAQYHGPAGSYSYELALTATDSSGLSASRSVNLPILADTTAPTAPSALAANAVGTSRADLTWNASTDDAAIDRYHIERCAGASCTTFVEIAAPVGAGTSFSDLGLSPATTFRYRVRAADGSGNLGSYSNIATTATVVANGLLAAYAFDEGIGTTINDWSFNGNTASVSGASWQPAGKHGGALEFGGTNDLAVIPSSTKVDASLALTIEAWVYPNGSQSGWRSVVQRETDAYFLHASSAAGALVPAAGGTFNGALDYFYAPSAIPANAWTHLAFTYDGSTMRLYVNGAEVNSKARTGTVQATATGAGPVRIGNNVPYVENFLGRVDDLRMYDLALTPAQIVADMNAAVVAGPDTTPPTAPASLGATADSATQITLAWSASTDSGGSGLASYAIERCTGATCANFVEIATRTTTSFVDTGLVAATAYRYRVRARDGAGNPSGYSPIASATTQTIDTTPPGPPGAIGVAANVPGQLVVSWGAATDASGGSGVAGYDVERCQGTGCSGFAPLSSVTGLSITDAGLAPATTYAYRVRAYDGAGNRGPYATPVEGATLTPDLTPPTAPTALVATTISDSVIRLTWGTSTDSGGSGLAGYRVERCQGTGCSGFAEIAQPTAATYDSTGLAPSTPYVFRVRAMDGAGNPSGYSGTASATTAAATGLVLAFGMGEGNGPTTFDASGNGNNGTITGAAWNTTGKYGNSLTFNGTTHVVFVPSSASLDLSTGLTLEAWVYPTSNQTGWRAIIQRETDAYMLHASSQGTLRPTAGGTFSGALDYFLAGSSIPINTWTHLAYTWNGATMRLYVNGTEVASKARTGTLQRTAAGAGAVRIGNNVPYGERFIGRIDEVRIYSRALSPAELATDMAAPIVPDATPPTAPGSLTATANGAGQITLGWTASTDTGGSGLAGYRVERCAGPGCSNFTQIAQPTTNGFVDTGLSASTTYRYQVRAVDGVGNTSGYSSIAEATTSVLPDTTPPTVPAGLTATANSTSQITLGWTASTDAGGSGLAGYRVERCAGTGCTTFAEIAQPTTNALVDAALSPSTTYRYRVRALDGAGNSSGYSTIAQATTIALPDTTPPSDPASLGATANGVQVTLGWAASTDAGGSGLAGYRVERCTGSSCTTFAEIAQPTTNAFVDTGLTVGTTYRYRVRAIDNAGNPSGYSNTASATTSSSADTTSPTAPASLLATPNGASEIDLSWTASTDAGGSGLAGYRIERCVGAGCTNFTEIATSTTNSFADTNLPAPPPPTTAMGQLAASMAPGTWAELTTLNEVPTLQANGLGHAILNFAEDGGWDPVTQQFFFLGSDHKDDLNDDDPRFVAYSATTNSWRIMPTPNWIPHSNNHGYDHNALDPDHGWFFHRTFATRDVFRYDIASGAWSQLPTIPQAVMDYPNCCMGLEYFPEMNGLVLAGSAGVGVPDEVYFYSYASNQWSRIVDNTPMGTWNNFVEYNPVHKLAIYGGGNDNKQLYSLSSTGVATALRNAPIELGVMNAIVTVDPVSGDFLAAGAHGEFYSYDIQADRWTSLPGPAPIFDPCREPDILVWHTIAAPVSTYGVVMFVKFYFEDPVSRAWVYLYKHAASAPAATYRYRVRALDGAGNLSGYSNVADGTTSAPTDTTPPTVPGGLGATANGASQITLGWTASTDAGGSGLAGYRVERCAGATCTSFAEIAQPTTNALVDTGVVASTTYRYQVRAVDGAGNFSGYSAIASATTSTASDTTPPTAPGGLGATANGASQITLGWTASTDTGGSGLAGYRVERCTGATCTSFAEIAQPTTNAFVNTGLAASTTYRYQVRAVDGAGNFSGYSAIASATTSAASGGGGLVLSYGFNENAGSSLTDSSGSGNTGTITGATWNTTGKFGNSLTFNGTTHVVTIPSSTSLNLTTAMTLEAWVYPTSSTAGWRAVIQRETDAYFLHAGYSGGALRPTAGGTFGTALDYFSSPTALPVNTWSHLALTWNGTTMRLYVNGAEVATKARTGTLQGTSGGAAAVRIGNNVPYGERFIGQIDEVRIYNRALSAAEVTADMNAPLP